MPFGKRDGLSLSDGISSLFGRQNGYKRPATLVVEVSVTWIESELDLIVVLFKLFGVLRSEHENRETFNRSV